MKKKLQQWYGLYELLDSPSLREALSNAGIDELAKWSKKVPTDEAGPLLAAHLANNLTMLLQSLREKDEKTWAHTLNNLRDALSSSDQPLCELTDKIPTIPFQQLLEIRSPDAHQVIASSPDRPDIPLGLSALLTGSSRSPSLISQIQKELASADRIDWLVSFIKWSGIRPLRDILKSFTDTANTDGTPRIRVLTTSYLGATDPKAVEFLLNLPNTEVRVSYDTHRTRLHAKAYLFHRNTDFGNAYIGSANVSRVALDEGLEWTAKVSQHELPYLWQQVVAAFESHWEDLNEFEYLAIDDLDRFKSELDQERNNPYGKNTESPIVFFDLKPYGYQQEILEVITAERQTGENRHLVIAATGTGKTMIAAFDYQRFSHNHPQSGRPSLLFVAHRQEILQQALQSFRHVLRDPSFGDIIVGGSEPKQSQHLFCSVQSWNSRALVKLAPDLFQYVVLDEAHHAAATTYQRLLNHVTPKVLLGLTATPERTDGRDIREDFGGRFSHEIRLPDAIERRLLCPFHYFGVADHRDINLEGIRWQRGGYHIGDLEKIFTGNDARAKWVYDQTQEYVTDPHNIRGLGFCVSQLHANFMADKFTSWGIPSVSLTADTHDNDRKLVQRDLVDCRINFIFTVDLYNEGIDIPEVDTVLLLRPTESLTVYLQQIGRGLRLHPDKPHLTVLDFTAPQHRQFRFANRFRSLTSKPEKRIDRQIEGGFPWLPSGCLIHLDRIARERVLDNIRQALNLTRPRVIHDIQKCLSHYGRRPTLTEILNWLHLDDSIDLLSKGVPCRLVQAAGGPNCDALAPYERGLKRGLQQLAFLDDIQEIDFLFNRWNENEPTPTTDLNSGDALRLALGHSLLWTTERPGSGHIFDVDTFINAQKSIKTDILEILKHRRQQVTPASGISFNELTGPLELHASYSREQIMLALGKGTFEKPHTHREGVLHIPERKIDAFFVTIQKSEAEFSPTTMYEDYAVTDRLFHWQSQSTTSKDSPTGKRYINHQAQGYTPLLFLRPTKKLDSGLTTPYVFCGPLEYSRHEKKDRPPMSIIWHLTHKLPAKILRYSRREAA